MTNNTTAAALTDEQRAAIQKASDIAHRVLIAGGDYGDELSDAGLRKELTESRDTLRALLTSPRAAGLPNLIEKIAEQWDGCFFDAPGGCDIDIGEAIRAAAKRLDAAPGAPVAEAEPAPNPLRRRVERLLVELHAEGRLSEGQCAKMLDISRVEWRELAEFLAPAAQAVAAPGAPVAEYDGNHVQNHCTECNEHEAECSCDQAVAADGESADNDAIVSMTKALQFIDSELTEYLEGMPADETSRKLRDVARNALKVERAAVSPAPDDETAPSLTPEVRRVLADARGAIRCGNLDLAYKKLGTILGGNLHSDTDIAQKVDDALRAAVSPATAEKVYYGGSVEAGPVAFDETATADERAANEWSDEDSGRMVRLIDALDRIVSGTTETSSDRLFAKTKPRNMTIRDAQEIARIHVSVARSILAKMDGHIGASPATADERAAFEVWLEDTSGFTEEDEAIAWAAFRGGFNDGRKTAAPAEAREPVLYQSRVRQNDEKRPWTKWENCSKEAAEDYRKRSMTDDWNIEIRELFDYPVSVPADAGEAVAWICSGSNDFAPIVRDRAAALKLSQEHGDGKIVALGIVPDVASQGAQGGKGGDRG